VFYSPLQRERAGLDGEVLPAPIDQERFKPTRQIRKHREGAVTVGTFGHPGKGQQLLIEWASENEPVDVYGYGAFFPHHPTLRDKGELDPGDVPNVLWDHSTFVHLPSDVESFGRGVVEAWASGCELVVNRNVGALYWIEENPEAISTAGEDFWKLCESLL
jgi:glycosyltransferase involved in cell wall biosynthesis